MAGCMRTGLLLIAVVLRVVEETTTINSMARDTSTEQEASTSTTKGASLQLHTVKLPSGEWQINCTLETGYRLNDTINIRRPPDNVSMIFCIFPSPCPDGNASWGPQNRTFSVSFTPEYRGLYVCIHREGRGGTATGVIPEVDPTKTTTIISMARDTSTAQEASTSTTKETSGSGFIHAASGIWVTCLGLLCA